LAWVLGIYSPLFHIGGMNMNDIEAIKMESLIKGLASGEIKDTLSPSKEPTTMEEEIPRTIEGLHKQGEINILPGFSMGEVNEGRSSKAPAIGWKAFITEHFDKLKYPRFKDWTPFKDTSRSSLFITGELLKSKGIHLRVIDIDSPKNEDHIPLKQLISIFGGVISKTFCKITPSGGLHIYLLDSVETKETEASLGISILNIDYQNKTKIINYGFYYAKRDDVGTWERKNYIKHPNSPDTIAFAQEIPYKSIDELLIEKTKDIIKLAPGMVTPTQKRSRGKGITRKALKNPKTRWEKIIPTLEVDKMVNLLKGYVEEGSRQKYALYLTGYLFKQGVTEPQIRDILKGVFSEDVAERLNTIKSTVNKAPDEIKGYEGIGEIIYAQLKDKEKTNMEMEKISSCFGVPTISDLGEIYCEIGTNKEVCASEFNKQVQTVVVKGAGDMIYRNRDEVISAYPKQIYIYNSFLQGDSPKYAIDFIDKLGVEFTIGPDLLPDLVDYINDSEYSIEATRTKKVISALIGKYKEIGKAIIKTDVDYPGFFFNENENKITPIGYECIPPTKGGLVDATEFLGELVTYFKGEEKTLATCLKWGLLAPFSYIKKQMGNWMPWLYLYGAGGTGKTTLGKIILYLYGEPGENNNIGGSGFDTVYRVGDRLCQSTFPIVVNEPKGAFDKPSVSEMIKTAVERTVGRGKYEGRRYRKIPALGGVVFTSNYYIPTDEPLLRRLNLINFTHKDRKTGDSFDVQFNPDSPKTSSLNRLRPLGQFITKEVMVNPEILNTSWKTLSVDLLGSLYSEIGLNIPEWLLTWNEVETLEDFDDALRERIRNYIMKEINTIGGRTRWTDREGDTISQSKTLYPEEEEGYKEKIYQIIQAKLYPPATLVTSSGKEYVCLNSVFLDDIGKKEGIPMTFKGMRDLLGDDWEYTTQRLQGRVKKVLRIEVNKFIGFL